MYAIIGTGGKQYTKFLKAILSEVRSLQLMLVTLLHLIRFFL